MDRDMSSQPQARIWAGPDVPSVPGIYNYLLGGTDHSAADQAAAEAILAGAPDTRFAVRENRAFLRRAVTYAAEQGVRQFVDLGSGFPSAGAVHEIAAEIVDDPHVLYVDHDPVVAEFCRDRVRSPNVAVVVHDLLDPWSIIDDPVTARLIDWSQPVAVLLVAILHFVKEDPAQVIATFRDHMVPGSFLILSHAVHGENPDAAEEAVKSFHTPRAAFHVRTPREVEDLLTGFDLVEPGLVEPGFTTTTQWGTGRPVRLDQPMVLAAVGRCP
jgi:O-methyltransferase involved in polyketide biosynthesis